MCVVLFYEVSCFVFLTQYWGIVRVPGFPRVNRPQTTWGGRILTLHLNHVCFLFYHLCLLSLATLVIWDRESQGVGGIFCPDIDAKTSRRSHPHPLHTLRKHILLVPKFKYFAPKSKYWAPKIQTHGAKIQVFDTNSNNRFFVPPKISLFVLETLPAPPICNPPFLPSFVWLFVCLLE